MTETSPLSRLIETKISAMRDAYESLLAD